MFLSIRKKFNWNKPEQVIKEWSLPGPRRDMSMLWRA
jgi:hypothetical protein